MCLLTFQTFGNHLLGASSKQIVRLERERGRDRGWREPVPGEWAGIRCPAAEVSLIQIRVFRAFRSGGENRENVGGTAG